jgi:hypothetical protein
MIIVNMKLRAADIPTFRRNISTPCSWSNYFLLVYSPTLNMEAIISSEISGIIRATWLYTPEYSTHRHRCEKVKFNNVKLKFLLQKFNVYTVLKFNLGKDIKLGRAVINLVLQLDTNLAIIWAYKYTTPQATS